MRYEGRNGNGSIRSRLRQPRPVATLRTDLNDERHECGNNKSVKKENHKRATQQRRRGANRSNYWRRHVGLFNLSVILVVVVVVVIHQDRGSSRRITLLGWSRITIRSATEVNTAQGFRADIHARSRANTTTTTTRSCGTYH